MFTIWALPCPHLQQLFIRRHRCGWNHKTRAPGAPPPRGQLRSPAVKAHLADHPLTAGSFVEVNVLFREGSAAGRGEGLISHLPARKRASGLRWLLCPWRLSPGSLAWGAAGGPPKWDHCSPVEVDLRMGTLDLSFTKMAFFKRNAHVFHNDAQKEVWLLVYFLKTGSLHLLQSGGGGIPNNSNDNNNWGGRFKGKGTYVHLWLIHVDVWEKSNQ